MRAIETLVTSVILAVLAAPALGHGGYYQGPKTSDGIPIPTTGPATGGPLPAGTPATTPSFGPAVTGRKDDTPATTPGMSTLPGAVSDPPLRGSKWEVWWSFHKERLLRRAVAENPGVLTPRDRGDGPPAPESEGRREIVSILLERLADESVDVRASAALALGRCGGARATEPLRKAAATDASPDVRDVALLALGMVGGEAEIPFLHDVLSRADAPVRSRSLAALAMGLIGGEDASPILLFTLDPAGRAARDAPSALMASGLVALGAARDHAALPALRKAAFEPGLRTVVRSYAVLSLGRLTDRESLEPLQKLVRESLEPHMRQSAVIALGHIATVEDVVAVNHLLHAAKSDRDQGTQNLAVLALGEIRAKPVKDQLDKLFEKSNDPDKPFRALALGLQRDLSAAPSLRGALMADEYEESLQAAYCVALALMGDDKAVPLIEKEVGKTRRFWSPGYAALSLALLDAKGSADVIHARLKKATDIRQRVTLDVALGILGDRRGPDDLLERVRFGKSVYESSMAAMGLGTLRARGAAGLLKEVCQDTNGRADVLRAAAVSALGRILDHREEPALSFLLDHQNFVVELDSLAQVRALLSHR